MMTLEEIKEATAMLEWHTPTVSHKTMAKALASLTEAYAEIERLKERLRPFVCEHNTYHDDPCHDTDGMSQENVRVDLHVDHLAPLDFGDGHIISFGRCPEYDEKIGTRGRDGYHWKCGCGKEGDAEFTISQALIESQQHLPL